MQSVAVKADYAHKFTYTYDNAGNRYLRVYTVMSCTQPNCRVRKDTIIQQTLDSLFIINQNNPELVVPELIDDKNIITEINLKAIYPNPTKGNLYLSFTDYLKNVNISIFDALGTFYGTVVISGQDIQLDMSMYSGGGIYYRYCTMKEKYTRKIVIYKMKQIILLNLAIFALSTTSTAQTAYYAGGNMIYYVDITTFNIYDNASTGSDFSFVSIATGLDGKVYGKHSQSNFGNIDSLSVFDPITRSSNFLCLLDDVSDQYEYGMCFDDSDRLVIPGNSYYNTFQRFGYYNKNNCSVIKTGGSYTNTLGGAVLDNVFLNGMHYIAGYDGNIYQVDERADQSYNNALTLIYKKTLQKIITCMDYLLYVKMIQHYFTT